MFLRRNDLYGTEDALSSTFYRKIFIQTKLSQGVKISITYKRRLKDVFTMYSNLYGKDDFTLYLKNLYKTI